MNVWLWPDRPIGKKESRRLREEHNAAVNTATQLLEALTRMMQYYEPQSLKACGMWALDGNAQTDALFRFARDARDEALGATKRGS